jgi:hypothetical protein
MKFCTEDDVELGQAVVNLVQTDLELVAAKKSVPSYTGQHSREDYYREQQRNWEEACARFALLINTQIKNKL